MIIKVKRVKDNAIIPSYAHKGDAGVDLHSTEDYLVDSGQRVLVSTGLQIAIPMGYEAQVRPRSGLALKHGISIVNTPGTIDAGYRGDIGIILINHGKERFEIKKGQKIAQMVFAKVEEVKFEEADKLDDTSRGTGGFGSTSL